MKAIYIILAAMVIAVGCNQPNSGTVPDPPDRDTVAPKTENTEVETQTILLEAFKKAADGTELAAKFKVAKAGTTPPAGFVSGKEYACYDEKSKTIIAAQGGCNGRLLHGKYAQYYATGDLMRESYYYYGLLDSLDTQYNTAHEITAQNKWDKGKLTEKVQ